MFDRLIDFLLDIIGIFQFWVVIDTYEKGIVLQFGKYRRTLDAGLHLVVPFGVDEVLVDNVVLKTMDMGTQSLTTNDDYRILISSFITYKIDDIKTFLLEVESAEDVVMSSTYGAISKAIKDTSFIEINTSEFQNTVRGKIKYKLAKYGVNLIELDFQNMTDSKTLRILTDEINLNLGD